MTMTTHITDTENRVHENCGYPVRDRRNVRLPGHIDVKVSEFVNLAQLVLTGGGEGWAGQCPCPQELTEAIEVIGRMNPEALTDPKAPWKLLFKGSKAATVADGDKPARLDEIEEKEFYRLVADKFSDWTPTAPDVARLPKPVREFVERMKYDYDHGGATTHAVLLEKQIDNLKKKLKDKNNQMTDRGEKVSELNQYIRQLENQIKMVNDTIKKRNQVVESMKDQVAHLKTVIKEKDERIDELKRKLVIFPDPIDLEATPEDDEPTPEEAKQKLIENRIKQESDTPPAAAPPA